MAAGAGRLFPPEQLLAQCRPPPSRLEVGLQSGRIIVRALDPFDKGKADRLGLGEIALENVVQHAGQAGPDVQVARRELPDRRESVRWRSQRRNRTEGRADQLCCWRLQRCRNAWLIGWVARKCLENNN